jgi:hypothetical protein
MTKRYVVVGINDYSGLDPSGKSNLGSCVSDADSIVRLLNDSFGFDSGESEELKNKQATSAAIQTALRRMLVQSAAGDVACFYYSGHGSRVAAALGQADCDKFYESIIPASGEILTDRDLYKIANTLKPSEVNFTVILDSCHSGGMDQETDVPFKCKSPAVVDASLPDNGNRSLTLVPCGICIPSDSDACADNVTTAPTARAGHPALEEDLDKVLVDQAKTTLIAGCKFDELSWETAGHGLLTKAFLDIVDASNFQINYTDLLDHLKTRVQNDFNALILPSISSSTPRSQTPQLRGQTTRMSEQFLDGFIHSI